MSTHPVCSKSDIFGEDYLILSKASSISSSNWFMLGLFVLLSIFFAWLMLTNVTGMYKTYSEYRDNVRYKLKEVDGYTYDPTNPAYDDEIYDNPGGQTDPLYNDNAYIQRNIGHLRKRYQAYNVQLRKSDKGEDVVDEKILAGENDEYSDYSANPQRS